MNKRLNIKGLGDFVLSKYLTATHIMLAIGALIIGVMVFHFVHLTAYPPVFIDESWNSNAAWNWVQTGVNFDPIHSGTLDKVGFEWLRRPNLGTLPWVVSFKLLGLGLFQARLVSYVFGIILLAAVVMTGYKVYGAVTGFLAALFVSLSQPFIISAHYARQDIILASVMMLLFATSFWVFEKNKYWMHFLLGLCLGVSMDIHQNAVLFIPGFLSIYLYKYKFQILRKFEFWTLSGGIFVGLLYFVAVHILPNPDAYFLYLNMNDIVLRSWTGMSHIPPLFSFDVIEWAKSAYRELGRYHFYENNLDFALIVASILYIGFRRKKVDELIIVFIGFTFLSFVFLQGNKADFYGILLYAYFLILVAESVVALTLESKTLTLGRVFIIGLVSIFIFNSFRHYLRPLDEQKSYNYYSVSKEIEQYLNPDDRLLGTPTWWLGFPVYDYKSAFMISQYYYFDKLSVKESLEKIKPSVLIVDDVFLSMFGTVDDNTVDGTVITKLPSDEIYDFIECCTVELVDVSDRWHVNVKIYRVIDTAWVK